MGWGYNIQELVMTRSKKPKSNTHAKVNRTTKRSETLHNISVPKEPLFYPIGSSVKQQTPCYIPLCLGSQSGHSHVLYYNANAPEDEIFDCATARLQAVIDLMESLFEYDATEKKAIPAVATVSSYLLNDAMTLLQELNPMATQLKKSRL